MASSAEEEGKMASAQNRRFTIVTTQLKIQSVNGKHWAIYLEVMTKHFMAFQNLACFIYFGLNTLKIGQESQESVLKEAEASPFQ